MKSILQTSGGAVVNEHNFGWMMQEGGGWWVTWGPSPVTIFKNIIFPFPYQGVQSWPQLGRHGQKSSHFCGLFFCVLLLKTKSRLGLAYSVAWILPSMSDSPFVLGSPLPLLHLFREWREVHPKKYYSQFNIFLHDVPKKNKKRETSWKLNRRR